MPKQRQMSPNTAAGLGKYRYSADFTRVELQKFGECPAKPVSSPTNWVVTGSCNVYLYIYISIYLSIYPSIYIPTVCIL